MYWQVANQGPASGNAAHFVQYAPDAGIVDEYATARYVTETERCCAVLDTRLEGRTYLVGDELTIADVICFPWTRVLKGHDVDITQFPHLLAWSNAIAQRPSAQAKIEPPADAAGAPVGLTPEKYAEIFGVNPTAARSS